MINWIFIVIQISCIFRNYYKNLETIRKSHPFLDGFIVYSTLLAIVG